MMVRLKKFIETVLISVAFALFAVTARAEEPWDGWESVFSAPADEALWLRGVTSVFIVTDDHVTDGCWTNESAVRTAIELSLRRAGIEIIAEADDVDQTSLPHVLLLHVHGEGTGYGGCLGTFRLLFVQAVPADAIVPGASAGLMYLTPMYSYGYRMGYDTMNETVRTFAIEQTDALALRILRARDAE